MLPEKPMAVQIIAAAPSSPWGVHDTFTHRHTRYCTFVSVLGLKKKNNNNNNHVVVETDEVLLRE